MNARTNRLTLKSIIRSAATLVLLAGFASSASAQTTPNPNPLGGPAVNTNTVPGERGEFGGGKGGFKKEGPKEIPHQAFMEAITLAVGPNAPADLRLSDDQRKQVTAASEQFTAAQREFMKNHKGEIDKLRTSSLKEKRTEGGKAAKKGDAESAMQPADATPEQRDAMMEEMRQLRDNAPKPGDVHKKIWAVLNPAQQAAVQVKLDEVKARIKSKVDEKMLEKEKERVAKKLGKDKKGAAPTPPSTGPASTPATATSPLAGNSDRRERLLQMLDKLTPEQREKALARLEQVLSEGGAKAGKAKKLGKQAGDVVKPAPTVNDLNLPTITKPE